MEGGSACKPDFIETLINARTKTGSNRVRSPMQGTVDSDLGRGGAETKRDHHQLALGGQAVGRARDCPVSGVRNRKLTWTLTEAPPVSRAAEVPAEKLVVGDDRAIIQGLLSVESPQPHLQHIESNVYHTRR